MGNWSLGIQCHLYIWGHGLAKRKRKKTNTPPENESVHCERFIVKKKKLQHLQKLNVVSNSVQDVLPQIATFRKIMLQIFFHTVEAYDNVQTPPQKDRKW